MPATLWNILNLGLAFFLIILNGFFVAAEFALVKVRISRIEELIRQRRPFAGTAKWLAERLEGSLSACQLGITMASLGLGWIGEPAFAQLLRPAFAYLGITSEVALHTTAFVVAFTLITALHLVIGEQAPKIFAIRRAEQMVLWCAPLLMVFYVLTYPLMASLNATTAALLRLVGIREGEGEQAPHTEEEIRALLTEAHLRGSLSRSEHRLLNAVFEFDDIICRQIMVPRNEVEYFDINDSVQECIEKARRTKHTRYPVCDGSLDEVLGVVHVKDLVGIQVDESFDWRKIMRPPKKVPANMPISRVLRHFQASHQLLAFVIDEYGTIIGIVTLENVLEQIIGEVEDEFDTEQPHIIPDGPDQWIVLGTTPVDELQKKFHVRTEGIEADTLSGVLMHILERIPVAGDEVSIDGYIAEILEVRDDHPVRVRLRKKDAAEALPTSSHETGDQGLRPS